LSVPVIFIEKIAHLIYNTALQ